MDKFEKASRRARNAIVSLLVAMEQPKDDEERRTFTLGWEDTNWTNLLTSMKYNMESPNNPYRHSVLIQYLKEHAEWAIREVERVRSEDKQRELINV